VLSRDKNWLFWKYSSCPAISRPALTPESFQTAQKSIHALTANKRLRPSPMGSLPLDFLQTRPESALLQALADGTRTETPALAEYCDKLAVVDLDLGMARDRKERIDGAEKKASLAWRALRVAGRTRLARFDDVDEWEDLDAVFSSERKDGEVDADEADENNTPDTNGSTRDSLTQQIAVADEANADQEADQSMQE